MNKRIDNVKKILSIPVCKCFRIMKKQENLNQLLKKTRLIHALKYMLLSIIEEGKDYQPEEGVFSPSELSKSLYLASEFTSRNFFLNLIRDLGYLENLI